MTTKAKKPATKPKKANRRKPGRYAAKERLRKIAVSVRLPEDVKQSLDAVGQWLSSHVGGIVNMTLTDALIACVRIAAAGVPLHEQWIKQQPQPTPPDLGQTDNPDGSPRRSGGDKLS